MKEINPKIVALMIVMAVIATTIAFSCKSSKQTGTNGEGTIQKISGNINGTGKTLEFTFIRGKSFNHPTFVIWLEDTSGRFIQTLFVTSSFGSGTFNYGDKSEGQWKPGPVKRLAALPYWSHKAGAAKGLDNYIPDITNPVPDAYSGATPAGNFDLETRSDIQTTQFVKVFMEINQTWDWNEYWTNNKYPDDTDYKTSCQPAVVYSAIVDMQKPGNVAELIPFGRSHYSGANGDLYTDLNTLTTALHIAERITVKVK
jgi:hypothetical protein